MRKVAGLGVIAFAMGAGNAGAGLFGVGREAVAFDPGVYNVVWTNRSADATGSMPLGGGALGLNAWVEGDDVLFYIGSPDSRIESGQLVKLGRVRLTLDPPAFRRDFRQELNVADNSVRIRGTTADGRPVALTLWVDAFQPVVHMELESAAPVNVRAAFESWRFQARPVTSGLEWSYRIDAAQNQLPAKLRAQHATAIAGAVRDPLANLTLGGRLVGAGLAADGTATGTYMRTPFQAWRLKTAAPVRRWDGRVLVRVVQEASLADWQAALDRLERATRGAARRDRARTAAWWRAFWDRSHIVINPGAPPADPGWQVGRNYQLFRALLACNRTGRAPTLFNGGFFTFDNPLPDAKAFGAAGPNPDERAWWGCMFMAQNQRLVYWPLLKSGDDDVLAVGLDFYRARAPVAQAKARHFLGVESTLFTESLDIYGLIAACPSANGLEACEHLTYHFTSALDFAYMMLEQYRYTGRDLAASLPVMLGMLKFYDTLYQQECARRTGQPLDARGRLVLEPGNACEMGLGCRNHADAIAGLRALAGGLLALPGGVLAAADRAWLVSFAQRIPDLPVTEKNGHRIIALAEHWRAISNPNEFPQLYAVFPFDLYGVGRPGLDLARDTWRYGAFDARTQKEEALCWKYGNIAVARLGLADEARDYALRKFLYPYGKDGQTVHYGNCAQFKARFPAFWVTYPFDAFPDMDHGGCAMIGLQEMLLQTPGDRILLLPAWPKEWDVDFKLHAPRQTVVEGRYRHGRLEQWRVTPPDRARDVEIMMGKRGGGSQLLVVSGQLSLVIGH